MENVSKIIWNNNDYDSHDNEAPSWKMHNRILKHRLWIYIKGAEYLSSW